MVLHSRGPSHVSQDNNCEVFFALRSARSSIHKEQKERGYGHCNCREHDCNQHLRNAISSGVANADFEAKLGGRRSTDRSLWHW